MNKKVSVHIENPHEVLRRAEALLVGATPIDQELFLSYLDEYIQGWGMESADPFDFIRILHEGSARDLLDFFLGSNSEHIVLDCALLASDGVIEDADEIR